MTDVTHTNEQAETSEATTQEKPSRLRWVLAGSGVLLVCLLLVALLAYHSITAPVTRIGTDHIFTVDPGMTTDEIFRSAVVQDFATSEIGLYLTYYRLYGSKNANIKAGRYVFSGEVTQTEFLEKLVRGEVTHDLLRLTVPEGMARTAIAARAAKLVQNITAKEFLAVTDGREGYLFPETYFLPKDFTATELAELMEETYDTKTAPLQDQFAASDLSESAVLTLASILEREANDQASMRMVSGILQNRLRIGMPLQADATIEYVLDEPLGDLPPGELAQNLRELNSPYNTYKNQGLPPTPIGNPGLTAIEAALSPTPSEYLFYITGTDGTFYYAETLAQHNQNIEQYLR